MTLGPFLFYLGMPLLAAAGIPVAVFVASLAFCFDEENGENLWAYLAIYFSVVAGVIVNVIVLPFIYLIGPFFMAYAIYDEFKNVLDPQTENIKRAQAKLQAKLDRCR